VSAILAVSAAGTPADVVLLGMLDAMAARGTTARETTPPALTRLAVGRHPWELEPGFSDGVLLAQDGDLLLAADASLYYRADLRARLRTAGVEPSADTAAAHILAAWRAWGPAALQRLEGDFAFILLEGDRIFCVRDFGGSRPLHYANPDRNLIVASTIGGVLAHPACPRALNLASVAETAAALWAGSSETCYSAVSSIPAGAMLAGTMRGTFEVTAWWQSPPIRSTAASFDDGAAELRSLLRDAVAERFDPNRPSTVWMSAGRDSSAIFGAGQDALEAGHSRAQHLLPVSISYPTGDPGREDEWIAAIAGRWNTPVHWLDIGEIPMMPGAEAGAAARDEPLAHVYENWNRALARGSRDLGARVAFTGYGGDQLFSVSDVYLADLLVRGRWRTLAREWGVRRHWGRRAFVRWAILPSLPASILHLSGLVRPGRPLRDYLERPVPRWIDRRFAAVHGLEARERAFRVRQRMGRRAEGETSFYLACPYFPRVFSLVSALSLSHGVETRSPLYDGRVIAFAVGRPREERNRMGDTKRLLRASMRGLLPDEVLAPRPSKTGLTSGYFDRSSRLEAAPLFHAILDGDPVLGQLGIVDVNALRQEWDRYRREGGSWGHQLMMTLHTELWLRSLHGLRTGSDPESAVDEILTPAT
jgi:asparagine synthase (glutamine-hydrolysing)